ncbi:MAG: hypothetical protein ACLVKO_01520 [Dysgonomonas sp.]
MGTETKEKFITGEELKKRVNVRIDKMFLNRKEQVITAEDIANGISGKELITAVSKKIDKFADK